VTVSCVAEELHRQQRSHRARGGDHLRAGETAPDEELVQVGRDQPRQEQEQTTELGAEVAWREVEPTDVGHISHDGTGLVGPFVIGSSRQLREPLFLEDHGDRRRAERLAVAGEGAADVVDGEVLLPECDDLFPKPFLLARRSAFASGGDEEVSLELIAELMDEDAKTARCIAEPPGRFGGGDTLDEEGPEGLVLSVSGVGWLQEQASQR
jgi:hypothetical protein